VNLIGVRRTLVGIRLVRELVLARAMKALRQPLTLMEERRNGDFVALRDPQCAQVTVPATTSLPAVSPRHWLNMTMAPISAWISTCQAAMARTRAACLARSARYVITVPSNWPTTSWQKRRKVAGVPFRVLGTVTATCCG